MQPIIDHIQITVKDLKVAEAFYDQFLPILGFDINRKFKAFIEEHDFHVVEYWHDLLAFAITSPREAFKNEAVHRRKPGALHHLAFRANTRAEVDEAYQKLMQINANIVEVPEYIQNIANIIMLSSLKTWKTLNTRLFAPKNKNIKAG